MVDDDGIFVVDEEAKPLVHEVESVDQRSVGTDCTAELSEPPVAEVESVDSRNVGTDLFGIRDLELGSENSDWPKLLDSEDAKEDGRELLQGATSGSGVPKLSPDLGGGRRGDGGWAERVPAPSVGQNTNLKTIPRGRYGGLRSRGVSGDHGLGGNSREEILDFPLS